MSNPGLLGCRVRVSRIMDDGFIKDEWPRYIGKTGTVTEFSPYRGGEFLPPYTVTFDNAATLTFWRQELDIIEEGPADITITGMPGSSLWRISPPV